MRGEYVAFRTRMEGHPVLEGRVDTAVRFSDGGAAVRDNYVVVKPAAPDMLRDDRYLVVQRSGGKRRFTWDVRVVATSADGVLLLGESDIEQMVGHVLSVPGRRCEPIELVQGVEEGFEFDRTARLHYTVLSFRFWSRPGDEMGES